MANEKKVPINYTARDFNSIKRELVNYVKRYYPETFRDFNEASFGSLMLDTVSYIGDIMSFYLDYQANESFLDTAIEYNNVIRLSKQMGFKLSTNPSSTGIVELYIIVPSNNSGLGPNSSYLPILKQGSVFSTENVSFILTENVSFANASAEVVVATVNDTTGIPLSYVIRMKAKVISGNLIRDTISVEEYARFRKINLSEPNVSEVISVFDSDGNEYYQVDYLSQDVIYKEVNNNTSDSELVPMVLRPYAVPRRFTLESEGNDYFLQFGYGSDAEIGELQPVEPSNVVLDIYSKGYISDDSFDPSKLIEGDKFGVAPQDTVLTVLYRVNNTNNVNVPAGSLKKIVTPMFSYSNRVTLDENIIGSINDSLQVYNPNSIVGDVSLPNADEIRRRTYHYFATQNRAVTKKDYEAILYAMPSKFGSVKRCNILQDLDSFKRNLNIYVLAEGADGNLDLATSTLKQNIKTWLGQYKMINDTIDILDGSIINFGINFEIIVDNDKNKFDVLNSCISTLASLYRSPLTFGQQLKITDIYKTLNNVVGVVDSKNVRITFKTGGNYSLAGALTSVHELMSADGRYLAAPKNVVYELKFSTQDIRGAVV